MPTLFRRSNGIYYFISSINGIRKWISTGETTRSSALKKIPSLNLNNPISFRVPLLSEFINQFLKIGCSTYRTGTIEVYERALYSFLKAIGDKKISTIGQRDIDIYMQSKLQSIEPVTMNIYLRTLRAAFAKAVNWKIIQANPFTRVALCPIPQRAPQFFTFEEFGQLIRRIKEPWLLQAIYIAAFTGMRRSEVVNLRWKDIDFANGLIIVGSDERFQTKTGKRRVLPINSLLTQILHTMHIKSTSEYVITLNCKKVREIWVSRRFKQYIKKMNVNKSMHFHTLRHTFASWLVQTGVPIYEVQTLMGHSSIKITQIYSHLVPKQLRTSVEMIVPPESLIHADTLFQQIEPIKTLT